MKKSLRIALTAALIVILCCGVVTCVRSALAENVPPTEDRSEFVTLTDAVPDAILEIRYYGTYNFVGTRIDGYQEPTALLTRLAAERLKAVSDDVMSQGYRLKI